MRTKYLLWIFLALVFGRTGFSQTGAITGQVYDPTGAVVAGARITAASVSTGLEQTVETSSAGIFHFAALPPASYEITAVAAGFQTQSKRNIVLTVAAVLPVNFTLSVAGATDTVEVQDSVAPPVESSSAELSTVIDSQQISNLPLVLRDPYQLVLLSPGAVTAANNLGGFSVNGQRDRNNNFMLDGADNNDTSVPGIAGGISTANPSTTQEFRVITNNLDAEYGRNTGAIIDVVTRGGANAFHGEGYEYGRYNALGARDFFNRKEDGAQNPYVRNNFGASLSGPIWKNHTFFFLNGDAQRFRTTSTVMQTTPTKDFRSGVFTFIDPYDGKKVNVDLATNPAANPSNLAGMAMDSTIKKIFALTPVGQYDNGDGVSTSYYFASPDPYNAYTFTGRFDHQLSSQHQLTVRYIYGHYNDKNPYHDEFLPGYGATSSIGTNHNGAISVASSLSPRLTNQLKLGYNQASAGYYCDHAKYDELLGKDSFGNGRDLTIPSFFTVGCWLLGDSNGQARLSSTMMFADTLSWVKGAHTLKVGGEFRVVRDGSYDNFSSRNLLTLDNYYNYNVDAYKWTGTASSTSYRTFQDLVWGATGAVATAYENQFFSAAGKRRADDFNRYVQHEWAMFAQDTWKINSHLTLIAGLRYTFNGVPYEHDANLANFYGDASSTIPAAGYFSFTPVGPGTGKQLYNDSWRLFEPRLGFAYSLGNDSKTVLRGGFGIFHDRIFDNLFGNARSNPPFQASLFDYPFTGSSSTYTVTNYPNPGNLTPSAKIYNGDYLYAAVLIDPNLKMPTTYSYNLGIQHQLTRSLSAELNYVGNLGRHGLREVNANPPQPSKIAAALAAGISPSSLVTTSLYLGTSKFGPMINNTAFYIPLLQVSVVSSNYSALQAKLSGRFHGLNMLSSYTYGHALDNGADPLAPWRGRFGLAAQLL